MILAVDIGNTNIVVGGLDESAVYFFWRLETDRFKTSDEYAVILRNLMEIHKVDGEQIEGSILSSVVPSLVPVLTEAISRTTGKQSLVVGPGLKNGLKIKIDDPAQLGSDRVADAVAAIAEYKRPVVIFDMGTATTFSVIDAEGCFLGGMIMPGALIGLDALAQKTAKLPQISINEPPRQVIGRNTVDCLHSGYVYGTAAMLDGIIDRVEEELGEAPTVVATGGLSEGIAPYCRHEIICDPHLLLKGLLLIYRKNKK